MQEPIDIKTKIFLKKIWNTLFVTMFWMFACIFIGLYFELAFIKNKISIGNIIFYVLFITTLILLIRYLVKVWNVKNKIL